MRDPGIEPRGNTHKKANLKEHFVNRLVITRTNGDENVVTFKRIPDTVLREFHAR